MTVILLLLVYVFIAAATARPAYRLIQRRLLRRALVTVVLGCSAAQVLGDSTLTYPFDKWSMYSSPRPAALFRRYRFITVDGKSDIDPMRVLAVPEPRTIMNAVEQLAYRCRCAGRDTATDAVLSALAAVYEDHEGVRVKHIYIYEVAFDLDGSRQDTWRLMYSWRRSEE